ncbi:MAG: DUF417 family protein [Acidobacteriaceae bacterium]
MMKLIARPLTISTMAKDAPQGSGTDARYRKQPVVRSERINMNALISLLSKTCLLNEDLDNHFVRASMVIIYFCFGYEKWLDYEGKGLVPLFLCVSGWMLGALLLAGFWNRKLGILGALGSVITFIATVTIIPFMPGSWAASAGRFQAMAGVAFLMKDVVLLAVSFYLLKQDLARVTQGAEIRVMRFEGYD